MLRAGEYGLEMYANQPLRDEDTYWHICQYLISYPGAEGGARDDNQADPGLAQLAREFGLVSPLVPSRPGLTLYALDQFPRGYQSVRAAAFALPCLALFCCLLLVCAYSTRAELCSFIDSLSRVSPRSTRLAHGASISDRTGRRSRRTCWSSRFRPHTRRPPNGSPTRYAQLSLNFEYHPVHIRVHSSLDRSTWR